MFVSLLLVPLLIFLTRRYFTHNLYNKETEVTVSFYSLTYTVSLDRFNVFLHPLEVSLCPLSGAPIILMSRPSAAALPLLSRPAPILHRGCPGCQVTQRWGRQQLPLCLSTHCTEPLALQHKRCSASTALCTGSVHYVTCPGLRHPLRQTWDMCLRHVLIHYITYYKTIFLDNLKWYFSLTVI